MKSQTLNGMKFKRLVRNLGCRQFQAVGILESIWMMAQTSAVQGDIGRFSDEDIAAWIDYDGNEVELIEALVNAGYLDRCEVYRLVIHDWEDHCPSWTKSHVKNHHNSEFAVAVTKPDKCLEDDNPKPSSKPSSKASSKPCMQTLAPPPPNLACKPSPNQTKPNLTNLEASASCPEASGEAPQTEVPKSEFDFPVRGSKSEDWNCPPEKIREWQECFPDLNVKSELASARQWVRDRPENRKTARGMVRFLSGWIQRAQNNPRLRSTKTPPQQRRVENTQKAKDAEAINAIRGLRAAGVMDDQAIRLELKKRGLRWPN